MAQFSIKKIPEKILPGILGESVQSYRISKSPDRIIMRDNIIPSIIHQKKIILETTQHNLNVLWIGTRKYTIKYISDMEKNNINVYTTDIDKNAIKYGNKNHKVCDAKYLDRYYGACVFDIVMMNGILGWGINTHEDQVESIINTGKILKSGGWLQLGWNINKILDPIHSGIFDNTPFEHKIFPGLDTRIITCGHSHVYDFFQKK